MPELPVAVEEDEAAISVDEAYRWVMPGG